ncbi:hypothetical protein NQ317_015854 [Molorchus minor]|uniref:MADF domain-containing protein n=1 Tax=Molorchus minor TaxID=1323400 RepID=A0ABQ9IRC7_9CUCU|nr:hypothetical protein NQ317_015854 [Molorchus minor]
MSVLPEIDEESLIDKIKDHPAIYNDQHLDYTNRSKKDEAWQEVASYMGKPGTDVDTNVDMGGPTPQTDSDHLNQSGCGPVPMDSFHGSDLITFC